MVYNHLDDLLAKVSIAINNLDSNKLELSMEDAKNLQEILLVVQANGKMTRSPYNHDSIDNNIYTIESGDFDPATFNEYMFHRAKSTAKQLGCVGSEPKNILEIGCGIGHLSKYLSELGHNVTSVDVVRYNQDSKIYQKVLREFDWPRHPFCFNFPVDVNNENNDRNFEMLKSYADHTYDLIIKENSTILEEANNDDLSYILSKLQTLLSHNGKIVIGFDAKINKVYTDSLLKTYPVLAKYKVDPEKLSLGQITIIVPKN